MGNSNLPQKDNEQNNLQRYSSFSQQLGIRIDFKTKREIIREEEHNQVITQIIFAKKQDIMLSADKNKVLIQNIKNHKTQLKISVSGNRPYLQLSENEAFLILLSALNTIEIIDTENWKSIQKHQFDEEITYFQFLDSCKKIVAGSRNKLFMLDAFKTSSSENRQILSGNISEIHKIDDNIVLVVGEKNIIGLIDINSGKFLWQQKYPHQRPICFYYDSIGKQLFFASENHAISVLNFETLQINKRFEIHRKTIIKIAGIREKNLLFSQSKQNKLVISDFTTGEIITQIKNTDQWSPFQFSPDKKYLLVRINDKLCVYQLNTMNQIFESQVSVPNYVATFIPDTTTIWVGINTIGGIPGSLYKIDFKTGNENLLTRLEAMVHLLKLNSDSTLLACGCNNGTLFLFDTQSEKPVCNDKEINSKKCRVAFIKEHHLMVVIHNEKVVIWDTVQLLPQFEFNCSAFPESKVIAYGKDFLAFNSKNEILFYNIAKNKITHQYPDAYAKVSFHPKKKQVIISSKKNIILFDYTNWRELNKRNIFAISVYYSANGEFIFASPPKNDKRVYMLSSDLQHIIHIINQPGGHIYNFLHIPETNKLIWNNSLENILVIINLKNENKSTVFVTRYFAISESKNLLYTIENKKHLKCYDTVNFDLQQTIYQSNTMLSGLALSDNNGLLAFYEWKNGVHVFDTQSRQILYTITVNECYDLIFLYSDTVLLINQGSFMTFHNTADGTELCTNYHLQSGYLLHTLPDESNRHGWFSTNKPEILNVYKTKPDGSASEIIQDDTLQYQQMLSGVINHQLVKNKIMYPSQYQKDIKAYKKAAEKSAKKNVLENKNMERKFLR